MKIIERTLVLSNRLASIYTQYVLLVLVFNKTIATLPVLVNKQLKTRVQLNGFQQGDTERVWLHTRLASSTSKKLEEPLYESMESTDASYSQIILPRACRRVRLVKFHKTILGWPGSGVIILDHALGDQVILTNSNKMNAHTIGKNGGY